MSHPPIQPQPRSSATRRGTVGSQQSSIHRYLEKKKELEAIIALESASADFASRFQALQSDMDVVAEAANVHGSVLAHWPHMFNLVRLFLNHPESPPVESGTVPATQGESTMQTGERLVRVPIDGLLKGDTN